ncbi:hypothetical protein EIP86_002871 [Pleurotus ostreatoroseus]|nr:hypothetical protein EIP86_002871 [Pleurotus ostreatoroseus]
MDVEPSDEETEEMDDAEVMEMRTPVRAATRKGMGRGKIKTFGAWESQEGYRGPMRDRLGGVLGYVVNAVVAVADYVADSVADYVMDYVGE